MQKIVRILFLSFGFLIVLFFTLQEENYLQLCFFDVGQGDAILIRTPDKQNILIDGGADNLLLSRIGEFLPWWETSIDYLVISHYHADHMMGLIELLHKYKVKNILVTAHQPNDFLFNIWQEELKQHNLVPHIVLPGETWQLMDNLSLQAISADYQHEDYNDNSLVLRLSYQDLDVLFTGDLTSVKEQELLAQKIPLAAEILKVGHHGSRYSSSREFLAEIKPEACVIQVGVDNSFKHPHTEALNRLEDIDCRVLRTDLLGNITIFSDGQLWWQE